MNTQEIFEKIESLFEIFKVEHSKTTKSSKKQSRKAVWDLKKATEEYRKVSIAESKIK